MKIPFKFRSADEAYRRISLAVNNIDDGHLSSVGTFTVTASVATTAVTNDLCHADSIVLLMPKTANAATEIATLYIAPGAGSFTVNHANNAQTDRDFGYAIFG